MSYISHRTDVHFLGFGRFATSLKPPSSTHVLTRTDPSGMFFPHPSGVSFCRFSEVYVPELEDRLDLKRVVDGYIAGILLETDNLAFTAVDLYVWARGLAGESLSDGAGQRPRYSLRYIKFCH